MSLESRSEKPATSDDDIWVEAADRMAIAAEAESQNRLKGVEALNFRWGDQWPDDIQRERTVEKRPALTINHTGTHCSRLENTLRMQRPRIKCHPVGDGADVDKARTVNGLIRHIEAISAASVAYITGAASAINIGWGYWRILGERIDEMEFDQELKIVPIRNTFSVYMDASCQMPDARDSNWCLITGMMVRSEYKRQHRGAKNADWVGHTGVGDNPWVSQWETATHVRIAEYYRIYEVADVLMKMNDGRNVLKSTLPAPEVAAAAGWVPMIDEATGKLIQRPTTRRTVQWFKLNGCTVVEQRDLPGRHIPVVRVLGNELDIDGKVKRKGMVQDLMDPARMYNYWRTAETERYALAPKAPWVAAEGQTDGHPEWNDANQRSYSVLTYKPVVVETGGGAQILPPPQRQMPAPVEDGMAQAAQGAEHDLMAVAGMQPEDPEIQRRVISGDKHVQRRQAMQNLTHYQYSENQTLAIAWTGELLLELIPYYYDTQRMQRIIGEDGVPQTLTINEKQTGSNGVTAVKNDLTIGRYSVVMDTGPDYATGREEAADRMLETLATPLGEVITAKGADIVLRQMDFHGADDLADRVATSIPGAMEEIVEGLPKQAQTIIAELQATIQQKDSELQQAQLEIAYGRDKETLKVHGTLEKTDRDNETRVFIADMNNTTKRDVAEIGGAVQLLNTSAESAHEEKMSDKLIKEGVSNASKD